MHLTIFSNIEGQHAIAMLATLVNRAGEPLILKGEELDAMDGEYNLDAEYKDGIGLMLTLEKLTNEHTA